jgi:hypothetical protein
VLLVLEEFEKEMRSMSDVVAEDFIDGLRLDKVDHLIQGVLVLHFIFVLLLLLLTLEQLLNF